MNIFIIRHGDPDYASDSLTNLGHDQAERLAQKLKNIKADEVYQSPYGRAMQTAQHSVNKWKNQPVTLDWLRELCWGDNSGDAYSTASPWIINEDYIKNKGYYTSGDEWKQLPEIQNDRIVADIEQRLDCLDDFMKSQGYERKGQLYNAVKPNNKNIFLFCHGGSGCAFLAHFLNVSFWQMISHCGLKVTSVSKISFTEKKELAAAQICYLNSIDHLDGMDLNLIK